MHTTNPRIVQRAYGAHTRVCTALRPDLECFSQHLLLNFIHGVLANTFDLPEVVYATLGRIPRKNSLPYECHGHIVLARRFKL